MLHTLLYTVHCTLMYVLLYVCTVVLLVVVHSLPLVLYSACLWCNGAADAQCLLIRLQRKSACLLPNCNEQNHSNYFCSSKISHWNSFYLPRFQIKILFSRVQNSETTSIGWRRTSLASLGEHFGELPIAHFVFMMVYLVFVMVYFTFVMGTSRANASWSENFAAEIKEWRPFDHQYCENWRRRVKC